MSAPVPLRPKQQPIALAQSIAATHSASKRRHEPNQEQAVRDRLAAFDNPVFGRLAEEMAAHVRPGRSFGTFSEGLGGS